MADGLWESLALFSSRGKNSGCIFRLCQFDLGFLLSRRWTCAKTGAVRALRALIDVTVPAQPLPGAPPTPIPRTPFQTIPGLSVPATGVLISSSPEPCPSTSPHQTSPACWLMSWCGLKSAPSPQTCMTTCADPSFPPCLSLPCLPVSGMVGPVPGQNILLTWSSSFQSLKELLLWLPPDKYYAMLASLWEKGSLGEEEPANVSPESSWRLEPPECSEVLVLQLDQETFASPGLSWLCTSEIDVSLDSETGLSKKA